MIDSVYFSSVINLPFHYTYKGVMFFFDVVLFRITTS